MATGSTTMTNPRWQDVAKTAQAYRDASISRIEPAVPEPPSDLPLDVTQIPKQLLTSEETKITEMSMEHLSECISQDKLSCTTITKAFVRRAALAQRLVNCVTEILPERALARAKYLDDFKAKHHRKLGPLHGIPISVKEHIGMKDLGLNVGFISWWDRKSDDDAHVLRILWSAGCVFYVRTTLPQSLMHLETSNNLYGVTINPFNRNLTAGGSSGGEGALLGLRGSCLGIGSDIGGSIRSPAANNGVYGLRPTSYRLPVSGWSATMLGSEHIIPVIGPLSTSLEGLRLFMKTIIDVQPWLTEPSVLPFPWRDELTRTGPKKPLKIGVMWHDGVVKPHPPITRALHEVVKKLKTKHSIEIVEWVPYKHDEAWEIIASLYFCDGAQEETEAIDSSGEPWRPLTEFIIKENQHVKHRSINDVWNWTCRREEYRTKYAKIWNDTATGTSDDGKPEGMVDAILCPVGPGAAPLLDTAKYWCYTSQWNLLDYPALAFPVSKVDPKIDGVEENYKPMNEQDEYNYKLYDPEKFKGAPISLQLVGRRYDDEKILGILKYIEQETGLPFVKFA